MSRSVFFVLLFVLYVHPALADAPPIGGQGYKLVWSDEFEKEGRPDPATWSYEHGFVRNNESQWYQRPNAWCEKGRLIIEARRVDLPNPNYQPNSNNWQRARKRIHFTSASLKTTGKREWLYGRLEVRAKIDVGPGLWPAIWTLGSARQWPGCGEVDLMEYYDHSILANAAWANKQQWNAIWDTTKTPLTHIAKDQGVDAWAKRFHTWRMDWTADAIKLYLDGKLLNEIDLSKTINRTKDRANPFHEPHYLILNLAIGGMNGGNPATTDFPKRMQVDYVRLYQQQEPKDPLP